MRRAGHRTGTTVARVAGCGLLLAAASLGTPTYAQGSREADAAAEVLFNQGKELMAAGQYEAACEKFEESQRLDPAIGTLLYLGECYDRLGRTASAWAAFSAAASESRKSNQRSREAVALERQKTIEARLSRVTVEVPAAARVDGLVVKRDGMVIGAPSYGTPTPVDPGKHVIEASAPGKVAWRTEVDVPVGGGVIPVKVPPLQDDAGDGSSEPVPPATSGAPPVRAPASSGVQPSQDPSPAGAMGPDSAGTEPPAGAPTPGSDSQNTGDAQRVSGYVIGAAGLAGVVVGAIFGGMASSTESNADEHCDPDDPSLCDQAGIDLLDEARGYATGANVALIAGGVLAATGIVLVLTAPSRDQPAEQGDVAVRVDLTPLGGPALLGIRGRVRW